MTAVPVTVRRLGAEEVARLAPRLVELQRAAYAVEAGLIGDDRIPQLRESSADLVAAHLTWDVVEDGDGVVAAMASSTDGGCLVVERLVVAPRRHREGLARRLVATLPHGPVVVSTGRDNTPARRLYEVSGFAHAEDTEVLPGLWVSTYRRG